MASSRNRTMFSHFSTLLPIIISSGYGGGLSSWIMNTDRYGWQDFVSEILVRKTKALRETCDTCPIFHYSSYLPQTFSQALLTALKTEKIRMYEAEKESSCWWILERQRGGDGLSSCQKTSYSMRVMDVVTWQHAGYDKHRHVQDKPERVGFF